MITKGKVMTMGYNPVKMKKLLTVDKFLHGTFEDVKEKVGCEDTALEMVFQTYVMKERIHQNAYVHLT
ncbi:hypothetical protein [Alkalihalobacterium elongatum]|uniref:hypothetical protein n=1 Tax=Alkalihalobacterium elongatum TaxID=2675466 RepID=UPI001C1F7171|nr:hypothetical protein [Alkalihalobacterium elongatum]